MVAIWERIKNEPALIFTILVTAYTAALAAGWSAPDWVMIAAAVIIALGGIFGVRANVSPTNNT